MPIRGLRSHPVEGVKAAKKRLPKLPRAPEADDLQEQSSIYLRERNKAMRLKRMREEMLLAKERGGLIERRLVERQLAYFLIAIRQKLMGLSARLYSRLGEERFPKEAALEAERVVHDALGDLARLPECAEPNWLERLEEEEG